MKNLPVLLLAVAGVLSAPYRPELDKAEVIYGNEECSEGDFLLSGASVSVFEYEGETENAVVGVSTASTGIKITARVQISPMGSCLFKMEIGESKLMMKSKNHAAFVVADESRKFSRELEAQELGFRLTGGTITELFPAWNEKTHVLNIKRGILSALQMGNSKGDTEQTDVNGKCKVQFKSIVGKDLIVQKFKNLSECEDRTHTELGFQSASFEQDIMRVSPLNSTSKCTYVVKGGRMAGVDCKEVHLMRPFSAGYKSISGALTKVDQRLTLVAEKPLNRHGGDNWSSGRSESLVFQHDHEEMKPSSPIVDRVDAVMNTLVEKSDVAVKQNYAHEFTELVRLFRQLDRKRMMPIWTKYFDCTQSRICAPDNDILKDMYRQYLLDALTYCGTSTCVYIVHSVIMDGAVSDEKVAMFLQGVAMVAKPRKAMIRDVLNIAEKKPSRQAYLSLGTLIFRFCSANPEECGYGKTNPVTQAEIFLEGKLGNQCDGQEDWRRVEEIIFAIKAVGNAGRPVHISSALAACARMSLHQNISIAALDAMRRLPCNDKTKKRELQTMLSNGDMDPERRIHVFLAVMRCPTKENFEMVVDQLAVEQSQQVGSFMWTHLTNLKESADPAVANSKKLLQDVLQRRSLKSFDLDKTKYSRSLEGTIYSKLLKSGLKTEGHVVFHPEGYLPRSALLNLTAHVMGVPLNLLEVAARIEGLETIIEKFFGPNGVIPDGGIFELFNISIAAKDIVKNAAHRARRSEQDVDDNIADLHARVNKRRIQPSGSLSIKMFGHDVQLLSYDDIFWMMDNIDNMNVISLLLNMAKGGQKTFTKSLMFLEMTQTVPTGLGLPLRLRLSGSAVASLELSGKVDVRNLFWGPSSLEVKGRIRPSAVAEIAAQMGIETHFIRSGMFVNASVFTSNMLQGGLVYKEGKILKVNLDVPEKPVEIFNVSSTPYVFLNGHKDLVKGTPRRVSPEFCLNSTAVGLGLCSSLSLPVAFREYESPYYPLSGPSHFGVKLVKNDEKLSVYLLQLMFEKRKVVTGSSEYLGRFEIGTPGATYSRGFSGQVLLEASRGKRRLVFSTADGKKSTELIALHKEATSSLELEAKSNFFTTKPIVVKAAFFNETIYTARHLGVMFGAHYDNLKVQQVWKIVWWPKMFWKLHSKTTYYPGKHITGEVEFVPSTRKLVARFDANQFNQTIAVVGEIVNTDTAKGLKLKTVHYGTKASGSLFTGLVLGKHLKKVVLNGTILGRSGEFSIGYLKYSDGYELQVGAEALGKKVEIFGNYSTFKTDVGEDISEMLFGGRYSGKVAGARFYLQKSTSGRDFCTTVFVNHDEPASLCLSIDSDVGTDSDYKQVAFKGRILDKTAALSLEYQKDMDFYGFNSTLLYNEKDLAKTSWQFTYDGVLNSEVKAIVTVGRKSAMARIYSATEKNTVVGLEGKGWNGKKVSLTATYSTKSIRGALRHSVVLEGTAGEKLPGSWELYISNGAGVKEVGSILSIKTYKLVSSAAWNRGSQQYNFVFQSEILKRDVTLISFRENVFLFSGEKEKSFRQEWDIFVLGKDFKYAWTVNYRNNDVEKYLAREVQIGLQYGRGKKILLTTNLVNSERKVGATVNVKFLQNREVTHTFMYTKKERRLVIQIEFLPNMFVRYIARIDKKDGWKLVSKVHFDWKRMDRSLKWVAAYIDKADQKGFSLQFKAGVDRVLTLESLYHRQRRMFGLHANAFGNEAKLLFEFNKAKDTMTTSFVTERKGVEKTWFRVVGSYKGKIASFDVLTTRSIFRAAGKLDQRDFAFSIDVLEKPLLSLLGNVKGSETARFSLGTAGRNRLEVTAKLDRGKKMAFMYFDFMKKDWNVALAAKYNEVKRSVTLTAESLKTTVGVSFRADVKEKIVGSNVFVNDNIAGWHAYLDGEKKAVVFNATVTPRQSFQVIVEVLNDNVVKFTTQRKSGYSVVNETSFSYELSSLESRLVLEWNKDTVQAMYNMVMPALHSVLANVTGYSTKAVALARGMTELGAYVAQMYLENLEMKISKVIDGAKEVYSNFKLKDCREKAVLTFALLLEDSVDLVKKTSVYLKQKASELRDSLPFYSQRARELRDKADVLASLCKKLAKNLTDSAKPVFTTAFELAKQFKIRGKTMEQLSSEITELLVNRFDDVFVQMKKELGAKLPLYWNIFKNINVPYFDKTVQVMLSITDQRLRQATFNYDVGKTTKWILLQVNGLKVYGRTVVGHVKYLKVEIERAPEVIKDHILAMLHASKKYTKVVEEVRRDANKFLGPLTSLARNVKVSVGKHYGPLLEKINNRLREKFDKIFKPFEKLAVAYMEASSSYLGKIKTYSAPIVFFFKDLKSQMKDVDLLKKKINGALRNLAGVCLERLLVVADKVAKVNETVNRGAEMARKALKTLQFKTTDEIVDAVYQLVGLLVQEVGNGIRQNYRNRELLIKDMYTKVVDAHQKLIKLYEDVGEHDIEKLLERGLVQVEDAVDMVSETLLFVVSKMTRLDVPTLYALYESNLPDHLQNCGVGGKVAGFLLKLRSGNLGNLTNGVKALSKKLRQMFLVMYTRLAHNVFKYSETFDNFVQYMKSVPKKSFLQFSTEVDGLLVFGSMKAWKGAVKMYDVGHIRLVKAVDVIKSTFRDFYVAYALDLAELYGVLKDESIYIYEDNVDEAVRVYNHYKRMLDAAMKDKYSKAKVLILKKMKILKNKMQELADVYGDKTWEELANILTEQCNKWCRTISSVAEKKFSKAKEDLELVRKLLEAKYQMLKTQVFSSIGDYRSQLQKGLLPKLQETYKTYYPMVLGHLVKLEKMANERYLEFVSKAEEIYNAHKGKTISQILAETEEAMALKYKALVKRTTAELKLQYARAFIVVKDILLPELKKEFESVVNQTLRATVILANTTVECFSPHYYIAKHKAVKVANYAKRSYPKIFNSCREKVNELFSKIMEGGKEIDEGIRTHPLYAKYIEKLVKNEYVQSLEQYTYLLPQADRKWKEGVLLAQKTLIRGASALKLKLEDAMKSTTVVEIMKRMKEVEASVLYTVDSLKPKVHSLLNDVKESVERVAVSLENRAIDFKQNPEEAFWVAYRDGRVAIQSLRRVDVEKNFGEASRQLIGIAFEVTDERTKEVAFDIVEKVVAAYKNIKKLPSVVAENCNKIAVEFKRQASLARQRLLSEIKWIKLQWEFCSLRPIVEHDVWREIATDIGSHEFVTEGFELGAKAVNIAKGKAIDFVLYGKDVKNNVTRQLLDKRSSLYAIYKNEILEKYEELINAYRENVKVINELLTKKTIEELLQMFKSLLTTVEREVLKRKDSTMLKIKEIYSLSHSVAVEYFGRLRHAGEMRVGFVKGRWLLYKPVLVSKMGKVTKIFSLYLAKMQYTFVDYKEKAEKKGREFLDENKVQERFAMLKKMTPKETLSKVRVLFLDAKAKLFERLHAFKSNAFVKARQVGEKIGRMKEILNSKAKPYLQNVYLPLQQVGNELHETMLFIYKYYGMKEKAENSRDDLIASLTYLPRVSAGTFASENVREAKLALLRAIYDALVEADKVDMDSASSFVRGLVSKFTKGYVKFLSKVKSKMTSIKSSLANVPKLPPTFGVFERNVNVFIRTYLDAIQGVPKTLISTVVLQKSKAKVEIEKYERILREVKNCVAFEPEKGRLMIRIPHYYPVEPSFSHQVNKVSTALKQMASKAKRVATKIAQDFEEKSKVFTNDLNNSYMASRRILTTGWSVASNFTQMYGDVARKTGEELWMTCRLRMSLVLENWKAGIVEAYKGAQAVLNDVSNSPDIKTACIKICKYGRELSLGAQKNLKVIVAQLVEQGKSSVKGWNKFMIETRRNFYPYQQILDNAIREMVAGKKIQMVFDNILAQVRKSYRKSFYDVMERFSRTYKSFTKRYPEFERMMNEYWKVHTDIIERYLTKAYAIFKLGKVGVDRTVRIMKTSVRSRSSQRTFIAPLKKTAIIFGKSHVLTFDRKFYEFPKYNRKTCTYLLARNFVDGNFTLLSQRESLIIKTPDLEVHLGTEITSKARVGNKLTVVKGLPVHSSSGGCLRDGAFVRCNFKQGVVIACDREHFDCTIELSGWNYAKTEGLLGTNNNEMYDDFKMPGGAIADTITEFADSWEVSGHPECVNTKVVSSTKCAKEPSAKCDQVFDKASPLSKYFEVVDPLPFRKACEIDSSSCDQYVDKHSYCNSTASYVNYLRALGYKAPYWRECAYVKTQGKMVVGSGHWKEMPGKSADVVVLMSERRSMISTRRSMANLLYSVNKRLVKKGYNTRYAIVGFGGDDKNEDAHSRCASGTLFMDAASVASVVKNMPYTGSSDNHNDVYDAIRLASTLPFRPEASRIFLVFNADKYSPSFYGPTFDETKYALKYEANASLYVFDRFTFKNVGKGKVIGQSSRRVYIVPNFRALPVSYVEFPMNSLSSLVLETDGAIFTNKIKDKHVKALATGLSDAVLFSLRKTTQTCRSCYLYRGNAGQGLPICRTDNMAETC